MDRRTFVKGAVAAAAGLGLGGVRRADATPPAVNLALPSLGAIVKPARTPVQHLLVVMMENRSVDHFLGWYGKENPDFDGIQQASFRDLRKGEDGPMVSTADWGSAGRNDYDGRGFADPDHGWDNGRVVRNGGRNDRWLDPKTGNDELTLATYEAHDVPTWAQLARTFNTYDRWHSSVLGPTQPNRYYLYSGQSGGLKSNDLPPERYQDNPAWLTGWDWPTVWDVCKRGLVTSGYYFSNLPETLFWGLRHLDVTRHVSELFLDLELDTLPQVSVIDPFFTGPEGIANDDHPLADIRLGETFLSDLVEAFTSSPIFRKAAMVITYDECGGFWDHVDPPRVGDDRATPNQPGGPNDFGQCGWRIPSTIVSPWTVGQRVDHTRYEHASFMRFVSDNWGLPMVTRRIRSTNSLYKAFGGFRTYQPEVDLQPYRIPLDAAIENLVDANTTALAQGEVPRVIPSALPKSDLHRLAETGWMDGVPLRLDHRFEDGFLRPSDIRTVLANGRRQLARQRRERIRVRR
jgi:phospholipase C